MESNSTGSFSTWLDSFLCVTLATRLLGSHLMGQMVIEVWTEGSNKY
jgi:hypothetical protein